jgi:hypothetical protein
VKGLSPLGLVKDHHIDRGPWAIRIGQMLKDVGRQVLPISNQTVLPVLTDIVEDEFVATVPTIDKHEVGFQIGDMVLPND